MVIQTDTHSRLDKSEGERGSKGKIKTKMNQKTTNLLLMAQQTLFFSSTVSCSWKIKMLQGDKLLTC